MATFAYVARTTAGERIEQTVEAPDRRAAMLLIERQGYIPVSVTEKAGGPAEKGVKTRRQFTWPGRGSRMGTRDMLLFTTELRDLLAAGMTLGSALNSLSRRKTGKASDAIVSGLRDEIVRGSSLSNALAQHPRTFTRLYVSMIRAGEASGALDDVLARLVAHFEKIQEVKDKVLMALIYPLIVMIMGAATLLFSMVYVVPKFETVFAQMGESLPLPTQILISSSRGLVRYGWIIAGVAVFLSIMANRAVKTKRGRVWWHRMHLRIPMIKGIIASATYSNFARTLETLLANGVPVLQALSIVEQTMGNEVIAREVHNARDRVTDGTSISGPLAAGKVFPRTMTDMLAVGEQTGNMAQALGHVARRYENELDRHLKIFTTALEPILIVFVAVMVGFVAISILMAVFNLTSGLNV